MDGQREWVLCQWRAERESHPTAQERDLWCKTIDGILARAHAEKDPNVLAELYQRLLIAHLKLEDYGTALGWAEQGLLLNLPAWKGKFTEGKAEILFLLGREREAMEQLDQVYPVEPQTVCSLKGKEAPRPERKTTSLAVVCPECGQESDYGATTCLGCGRQVDECFHLVKRTREVLGPYDKGTECQVPKGHRRKEFSLFHTTYTVDFDDRDHYLTGRQVKVMGTESVVTTSKGWTLWPPLLAIVVLTLFFILAETSALDMGNELLAVALAILWITVVLPLSMFFLWAVLPPQAIDHDQMSAE